MGELVTASCPVGNTNRFQAGVAPGERLEEDRGGENSWRKTGMEDIGMDIGGWSLNQGVGQELVSGTTVSRGRSLRISQSLGDPPRGRTRQRDLSEEFHSMVVVLVSVNAN